MSPSDDKSAVSRWSWLWLSLAAVLLLGAWVAFFDSHSVAKRLRFERRHTALKAENDSLRRCIETLQQKLDPPLADSTIERIAREQYGMHRPGETVYRVE